MDQVRALRDEAIYSPANVKKRVYIVDEVHMLSTPAFNALLKILEEPPEHLMFILATTELHKVPATILSRCQRFSFKRITPQDIAARLLYVAEQEGIGLTADDVIANLKGHEEEYDALVFACGNAVPVFAQHAGEPWNRDLMEVLKTFGETGKPMIGHCAAGMMFGFAGVAAGRRVAVHPMAKAAVTGPVATDAPFEIDGNFFTAQEEHAIPAMIGRVVEALK